MARIASLLTYADCIDLLLDFSKGDKAVSPSQVRRAVEAAYEEIAISHHWTFLERQGRIYIHKRQTTGTCSYDHTGGTSERLCTLSDTTAPSWIDDASIRLGDYAVVCDVESGTSGETTFTLDAQRNPGEDVDDGSYVFYQRYVRLPNDFRAFTGPMPEQNWRLGQPITLTEMLAKDRFAASYGQILYHCVAEVPDIYDQLALFVYPQPSRSETIDFVYTRWPRVLRYSGHDTSAESAGTITVTSGSATVEGSSTAFTSDMEGAILRSGTGSDRPTGRFGKIGYSEERSIISVADSDTLTLDAAVATAQADVNYVITDPIDIGRVARNAFLRCAEKHLALTVHFGGEDHPKMQLQINALAEDALRLALAADNPYRYDPSEGSASLGGSHFNITGD